MKFSNQILLALVATATSSADAFAFAPQSLGCVATPTTRCSASVKDAPDTSAIPGQEGMASASVDELMTDDFMKIIDLEAQKAVDEMLDEECEVDEETGGPMNEICVDEEKKEKTRSGLRRIVSQTLQLVRGSAKSAEAELIAEFGEDQVFEGDILERGWEMRGNSSSIVRNAEIWKVALKSVFSALKPRKMRAKGATEEEVQAAQIEAAEFIRDNLLKLGPSFVKVCKMCKKCSKIVYPIQLVVPVVHRYIYCVHCL